MADLRQFEALRAVHAEGSVTAAARRLGWGQPTVDYHLKNLERLVGAPVLVRSPRGSRLTPVGMLLLERAQEILTLSERAIGDAREFSALGRVRLRFGTFATAAASILPFVAGSVGDLGIEIDAMFDEVPALVDRINRGALDAALVYTVPGYDLPFRPNVVTMEVFRDPLLLAVPVGHPLASRTSVDLAAVLSLSDERWVFATSAEDAMDRVVADAFAAEGHVLDVAIRTDDFQVLLGMTAARMVVGIIPGLATAAAHPGIVLLPVDDPSFVRSILVATPAEDARRRPSPAVRHLVAAVRDGFAAVQAGSTQQ
ncbi:LysR family transcriptional regulator [Leifsonia shinshuensis]|uniref:LysR family transcriptional regulator n=1 Tax=Leifsonia shinshuensis TaxID=150026 RepID=A0A7G6YAP0_9MICO|nr:LysR family transcriptional regulator [Leifsonia shinshuensis]QNE35555.1 LysR family transcriptional regulator [Leifsonia shinshuensis]